MFVPKQLLKFCFLNFFHPSNSVDFLKLNQSQLCSTRWKTSLNLLALVLFFCKFSCFFSYHSWRVRVASTQMSACDLQARLFLDNIIYNCCTVMKCDQSKNSHLNFKKLKNFFLICWLQLCTLLPFNCVQPKVHK